MKMTYYYVLNHQIMLVCQILHVLMLQNFQNLYRRSDMEYPSTQKIVLCLHVILNAFRYRVS